MNETTPPSAPRAWIPWRQLLRFAVVGLCANAIGYLLYSSLTYLGLSPKATVSILYPIGAAIGFFGNKRHTFGHSGDWLSSAWRYVLVHTVGMLINLLMLWFFVDRLGVDHRAVQAVAVFVVAAYLFIAMRCFVFASRPKLLDRNP